MLSGLVCGKRSRQQQPQVVGTCCPSTAQSPCMGEDGEDASVDTTQADVGLLTLALIFTVYSDSIFTHTRDILIDSPSQPEGGLSLLGPTPEVFRGPERRRRETRGSSDDEETERERERGIDRRTDPGSREKKKREEEATEREEGVLEEKKTGNSKRLDWSAKDERRRREEKKEKEDAGGMDREHSRKRGRERERRKTGGS